MEARFARILFDSSAGELKRYTSHHKMSRTQISIALEQIFGGITRLHDAFPHRAFTIDGRLVGDVGEVIAALEYDLVLDPVSRPTHDAKTSDGRDVQIKATFKAQLTIRSVPDYYLGLKLSPDGDFKEIFNGPGDYIRERYAHPKRLRYAASLFPCIGADEALSQGASTPTYSAP